MKKDSGGDAVSTEDWPPYVDCGSKLTALIRHVLLGNALLIARVAMSSNAFDKASMSPFQAEMQHRRLWACYMMTAYSPDPYLQKYTFPLVKGIGLPCRDEDFNPEMVSPAPPSNHECHNVSVAGELIKIICLWQVLPRDYPLKVLNDQTTLANFCTCNTGPKFAS